MAKMGRPKIQIDKDSFEKLCGLWCSKVDIASYLNCSEDTLERWIKTTYNETFAVIYQQKSAAGRNSLRRKQYEIAMGGNVTMLIWLGKQHLDQKDKQEINQDTNLNVTGPQVVFTLPSNGRQAVTDKKTDAS